MKWTHFKAKKTYPTNIANNRITTIFEDSKERLWLGSYGGGLLQFNKRTHQFIHYQHNPED